MDIIEEIAQKHNLVIIEDAAHALESSYKQKKIGNSGNLTAVAKAIREKYPNIQIIIAADNDIRPDGIQNNTGVEKAATLSAITTFLNRPMVKMVMPTARLLEHGR